MSILVNPLVIFPKVIFKIIIAGRCKAIVKENLIKINRSLHRLIIDGKVKRMKGIFILTSVLLGSSLLLVNKHQLKMDVSSMEMFKRSGYDEGPVGDISIIIDKSDYELSVYDSKGWFATYPVVFGNNSLDDKKMEGDKKTPEGCFRIISKRVHEKWCRFLALDYPTKESWERFNARKKRGEIPASASIGGAIGIHGTWPDEDFIIDKYKNWTLGCISMKKDHVLEIYAYTPIGTKVVIRK